MATMASFKTAWNQREVRLDVPVAADLKVGQVCTLVSGKLTARTDTTKAVGDYIIAQSDMTVGKNRFIKPVSGLDYEHKYSDVVTSSTTAKHVMVFVVTDVNDVTYTTA